MLVRDLPAQPTTFVGRTQELTDIISLLDNPDCRLLTLIGPGGIGKTRLSLEAASLIVNQRDTGKAANSQYGHAFAPNSVTFVPLQPLDAPALILSAVAEALGLQFYSGSDPKEQLMDYLRPTVQLLILDNFEHLLDDVDLVAELLINAPKIKILVTSRETLNLREEWLYQIKGMRFPDREDIADAETYSAVQLFAQSARRVRPDFSLSAEQQSVLRICRLVEGMPLALEMTAAWLRRLPANEIVRELDHGLDILESPARNVPARHRSIRMVFEHSWNLLTDTERGVFAKLSVFRGGFRREAAEAISGATLVVLSALVDKSLLYVDSTGRYDLHELLRQYSEEKLNESVEASQQAHDHHYTYYMDFLTQHDEAMMAHMSVVAVTEITTDLKNIRAAVDWMLEHNNAEVYGRAMVCLTHFYQFRCFFEEGEEVAGRVVPKLRGNPPGKLLGQMLIMQGWFIELKSQDYARAKVLMEEGLLIGRELGYTEFIGDGLMRLSEVAVQVGNYEQARQLAQESVDHGHVADEKWHNTFGLALLGSILLLLGDYTEATTLIREAIRIAETYDVPSGLSDARNYLGQVELALHAYQDAKQTFEENLAYSKQVVYLKGTVLALVGAGETAMDLGEYFESRRYLSEALKTAMESNQIPFVLDALTIVADLLAQTDNQERGMAIVALVLDHHAATHQAKSRAARLFSQLESQLQAEIVTAAVDYGKSTTIGQVVSGLLDNELSNNPVLTSVSGAVDPILPLSERELEILRLVANGLSNREIADQLFLATGTVKWYLSEIYGKLYVTSRTQAIARARSSEFSNMTL